MKLLSGMENKTACNGLSDYPELPETGAGPDSNKLILRLFFRLYKVKPHPKLDPGYFFAIINIFGEQAGHSLPEQYLSSPFQTR